MSTFDTRPLWQDTQLRQYPRLTKPQHVDVAVIGGGITGLTAAYLLKQSGKTVCVLERDTLGSGDTGHTTAHLTCVTDVRLKQLVKVFGREQAALAWYAGQFAIDTIERIIGERRIECQFRRVPGFLHAEIGGDQDETEELREESEMAHDLGFDVDFVLRAPIVAKPGMRVANQAKMRPLEYLAALAEFIDGDGSAVFEHSEVGEIEDDPLVVVANDTRIECEDVFLATHVPLVGKAGMLGASLLQTKLAPYSSYVVSGRLPAGSLPQVSLWDTSNPYYYLRVDAQPDFDRVIFGGNDHKTGQAKDTSDCYRRLEGTLRELLPAINIDRRWSGQVIETNDGLPLIGETAEHQYAATGFNGNGMTFATIAGLMVRDAVLQQGNPWRELFSIDRKKIRGGTWDYLKENMDYPYYMVADRLTRPNSTAPEDLAKGQGQIIKLDGQKVACSRDKRGRLHQVSAVCTHLGCLVHWNDAECTWDCPCHGSRFAPNGKVLAGPAETPLARVPQDTPKSLQSHEGATKD